MQYTHESQFPIFSTACLHYMNTTNVSTLIIQLILEASGVSINFESSVNITSTFEIFQSISKQLLNIKALCEAVGLSGNYFFLVIWY